MSRKFLTAEPLDASDATPQYKPFRKEYYFLYGTLMDAPTLSKILHLRHPPTLLPSSVIGYRCKLWGPYPVLLSSLSSGTVVKGMAYEIQSAEEAELLQAYETNHYEAKPCIIEVKDGRSVRGRTFRWKGTEEELKDGVFDLKDWQMRALERRCFAEETFLR
ncbi:hypothetical protein MMC30_002717 [Trapelia coarctata]|nr:hypothetical protein [Trapelia coarctata]